MCKKILKKILAVITVSAITSAELTGCNVNLNMNGNGTADSAEAEEKPAEAAQSEDSDSDDADVSGSITGGGYPWIDSNIKNNVVNSECPDLKDDFNFAVNYNWLMENEPEQGHPYISPFTMVRQNTTKKVMDLLEDGSITGHDAELVHAFYNSIMDWDERNELGMEPVKPVLKDISGISTIDELSDFICDPDRSNYVATMINIGNKTDLNAPDRYITTIRNDELLLEDAAEYSNFTDVGNRAYTAKKELFTLMEGKLGVDGASAENIFNSVMAFEEQIAGVSMSAADELRPDYYDRINNIYDRDKINTLARNLPLEHFIEDFGYGDAEEYIVFEPDVVSKIDELYTQDNLDVIKNYMTVHFLLDVADKLDRECYEAYIRKQNIQTGAQGAVPDSEAAYNAVLAGLYEPLERMYLEKYDCTEMKADITGICKEVIDKYKDMLYSEDWMSEDTRQKAINKLEHIRINAVYPDKWTDYSSLKLKGLNYFECSRAISSFKRKIDIGHTNAAVDRELWDMNILECNAYYEEQDNSINIILGILDDVFYDEEMSREEMLGGIGTVIGHEISHAFDPGGAKFDENGKLSNWWKDEDMEAFQKKADKLIAYYDGITAFKGYNVSGANVQDEACADLAGVKVILMLAAEDESFDYDKFFRQYATLWRVIDSYEREVYRLSRDPHPLNYLRVNVTLQQYDEFIETYGIGKDDGMYLAPEDRIAIW